MAIIKVYNIVKKHKKQGSFVSTFAKLRKATARFITSVLPSVHMEQLGSHWTDFDEI